MMKGDKPFIMAPIHLPFATRHLESSEKEKLGFGVLLVIFSCVSILYIVFLLYKRCHGVKTHDVREKQTSLEAVVNVNQSRSLDDIEKDCDILQSLSSLSNQSLEGNREIL